MIAGINDGVIGLITDLINSKERDTEYLERIWKEDLRSQEETHREEPAVERGERQMMGGTAAGPH